MALGVGIWILKGLNLGLRVQSSFGTRNPSRIHAPPHLPSLRAYPAWAASLCPRKMRTACRANLVWAPEPTQRPQSSSFLGLPYRIQNMNPEKELLWAPEPRDMGQELRTYCRSPKVGNPRASVLKGHAQAIPALIVLNPVSNFLGYTIAEFGKPTPDKNQPLSI